MNTDNRRPSFGTIALVVLLGSVVLANWLVDRYGTVPVGLGLVAPAAVYADSLAWSLDARRGKPLPGCRHGAHGTGKCSNCLEYALRWLQTKVAPLVA